MSGRQQRQESARRILLASGEEFDVVLGQLRILLGGSADREVLPDDFVEEVRAERGRSNYSRRAAAAAAAADRDGGNEDGGDDEAPRRMRDEGGEATAGDEEGPGPDGLGRAGAATGAAGAAAAAGRTRPEDLRVSSSVTRSSKVSSLSRTSDSDGSELEEAQDICNGGHVVVAGDDELEGLPSPPPPAAAAAAAAAVANPDQGLLRKMAAREVCKALAMSDDGSVHSFASSAPSELDRVAGDLESGEPTQSSNEQSLSIARPDADADADAEGSPAPNAESQPGRGVGVGVQQSSAEHEPLESSRRTVHRNHPTSVSSNGRASLPPGAYSVVPSSGGDGSPTPTSQRNSHHLATDTDRNDDPPAPGGHEFVVPTAYAVDNVEDPAPRPTVFAHAMAIKEETSEPFWPFGTRRKRTVMAVMSLGLIAIVAVAALGGAGRLGGGGGGNSDDAVDEGAKIVGCFDPRRDPPIFCNAPNSTVPSCWEQMTCDLDGDPGWDQFGHRVSMSEDGKRIAVSADRSDVGGVNSGSVRVYDVVGDPKNTTRKFGATSVLVQLGQDIVGGPGDEIDGILSGDGSHLAIASSWSSAGNENAGQVWVYRLDVTKDVNKDAWVLLGDSIVGEFSQEQSGKSIDLSHDGSVVAIGAPGSGGFGRARVFRYIEGKGWVKFGSDLMGEGAGSDFGWSLSCSYDCLTVAVGARHYSARDAGYRSGQLRVYRYDSDSDNWSPLGNAIDGEAAGDRFGEHTSISANSLVVAGSAWQHNGAAGRETGQIRVFRYDFNNSAWAQIGQSILGDGEGDQLFSVALSANGQRFVAGAGKEGGRHYARMYGMVNGQWRSIGGRIGGDYVCDIDVAVSLSGPGTRIIFSCPSNTGGVVRLFEQPWKQISSKLGSTPRGKFGDQVSFGLQGTRVAVSASDDSIVEEEGGAVRVYDVINSSMKQVGQSIYGSPGDKLRGHITKEGRRLIVGARYNAGVNGTEAQIGKVRVFEFNDESRNWTQIGQSLYGDAPKDRAGSDVAISPDGGVIAVGMPFHGGPGAVRVYKYIDGDKSWEQVGSDMVGNNTETAERFGWSIALSDDASIIAVGSRWNDVGDLARAGSIRVFRYEESSNSWVQNGQTIYGDGDGDIYGSRVRISSDGMTVSGGAYLNSDVGKESGHVRAFSYMQKENSWRQLGSTFTGDNAGDKLAPHSLSADGRRIAVSSSFAQNNTGFARVFDFVGNDWIQVGSTIKGFGIGSEFGTDIVLSDDGNRFAVGSRSINGESGAVRLFDLPERLVSGEVSVFNHGTRD